MTSYFLHTRPPHFLTSFLSSATSYTSSPTCAAVLHRLIPYLLNLYCILSSPLPLFPFLLVLLLLHAPLSVLQFEITSDPTHPYRLVQRSVYGPWSLFKRRGHDPLITPFTDWRQTLISATELLLLALWYLLYGHKATEFRHQLPPTQKEMRFLSQKPKPTITPQAQQSM